LIDGGIDAAHDVDVLRVLPEAGGDLLACDQIAAPRYEKLEQVDARSREPEPDAAPRLRNSCWPGSSSNGPNWKKVGFHGILCCRRSSLGAVV
jgi:hypothetical protein